MTAQMHMFELFMPERTDYVTLTNLSMSETDPHALDANAAVWHDATKDLAWDERPKFHGWHVPPWSPKSTPGNHPITTYVADIGCEHWADFKTIETSCFCVSTNETLHRAYCAGCQWWTPVFDDEGSASEAINDHCWPGWRDLPVRCDSNIKPPHGYPDAFTEPGAPVRDCRGNSGNAMRHVPGGSKHGGYRMAVKQECATHDKHTKGQS